uniref:Protein kinase domain-containing protein n=1 Tax=Panagrellus redivivus TaxID=6233 RepID=A0A7E4USE2_PANRE
MTSRPRLLRAVKVHGPSEVGKQDRKHVELTFINERLHANGVFSNVYSATLTSPRILPIAIKKCWPRNSLARRSTVDPAAAKEDALREDANDGKAEAELLTKLKHAHVVSLLYTFSVKVDQDVCNCMILEFLPTDLGKMLKNRHHGKRINLLDAKLYSWQLFAALDFCASKGVAHRDVKPSNLLVDDDLGILKLADFGNAKILLAKESYPPYQVTRYYRAPELVFGSHKYTTKVDTWAAACVLGELLTGRPILPGTGNHDQGKLIASILGYPNDAQLKAMGCDRRPRLIRRDGRGLRSILPESSVNACAFELLNGIFKYEPYERLSYDFILGHDFYDDLRKTPAPIRKGGRRLPDLDFWISEESTQDSDD